MHLGHRNKQHPYYMEGELLHITKERELSVIMSNMLKLSAQYVKAARTGSTVLGSVNQDLSTSGTGTGIPLLACISSTGMSFHISSL
jgi:hypothetical protein